MRHGSPFWHQAVRHVVLFIAYSNISIDVAMMVLFMVVLLLPF